MHQIDLAQKISTQILEQGTKETPVTIRVGELLSVDKQELLDLLTVLGHEEVKVIRTPSKVTCECGYEGPAEIYHRDHHTTLFRCPRCKKVPEGIESGEELELDIKD